MRGKGCLLACGAAMVLLALTSEARGGGPSPAPERLTSLPGDEGVPAFAPDGRTLVFEAGEAAGRDLALLDLETLEQRWLTRSPETREVEAAWSPDGRTLFFRALSSEGSSIRSLGIDGGRERIIVEAQHKPTRLRVSPRGRLAFSTRESGRTQLWTWREGGSPIRLIDHAGLLSLAGWTADESGLVVRERSVAGQDLWLVAVDGGELRRLTDHPNEEWMAVPSPSSARVAYYTTYERDMTDIRLLSLETGAHTRLTRHPSEDFYPAWSPDDRFIAFLSDRVAKSGLWKVEIDTGVESPILPSVRLGGRPV